MSYNHPPYFLRKLSIAISLGHDKNINVQNREHPWYPLWDLVLNRYFLTTALHIGPQWPLWRLQIPDEVDPDVEAEEAINSSSAHEQHELQENPSLAQEVSDQDNNSSKDDGDRSADNDNGTDDGKKLNKTHNRNNSESGTSDGGSGTNDNNSSDNSAAAAGDDDDTGTSSSEDSQDTFHDGDDDNEQAVPTRAIHQIKDNLKSRQRMKEKLATSSSVAKSRQPVPDHRTLGPVARSHKSMLSSQRTGSASDSEQSSASLPGTAVKGKQRIRSDKNPYEHAAAEQTRAPHRRPLSQSHIAYGVLSDVEQGPSKMIVKGSKTSPHSAKHKVREDNPEVQSNKRQSVPTTVRHRRIEDEEESRSDSTEENIVPAKINAQVRRQKQSIQVTLQRRAIEPYSPEEWEDDSAGGDPVPVKSLNSSSSSETHSTGAVTEESSNTTPPAVISWKDSFRIPDFVLLRVKAIGVVPVKDMAQQTASLEREQVALLLEVKRLILKDDAADIERQLDSAKDCLQIQAAYVFSRSEQLSVKAVAVAGHYFQLTTIRRNSSKPNSTQSEISDPTWASSGRANQALLPVIGWTKTLDIGSKEAFAVWNQLRQELTKE